MPEWESIFSVDAPLLEIFVRGTLTFLALTFMMRLVGQREAGGLAITDVLLVVLVADAASAGLTGDMNTIPDGLLLVATILLWSVVLDALAYRWPRLGVFLKAKPKPLVQDGRLNRRALRREFITHEELLSTLRLHGLTDIAQVKRAYLEPNGLISVIPVDDAHTEEPPQPPTP